MYQSNSDDNELIRRIQSGDKKTFAELYRPAFTGLCEFVHRFVEIAAIPEELEQDLFLKSWRRRLSHADRNSFRHRA